MWMACTNVWPLASQDTCFAAEQFTETLWVLCSHTSALANHISHPPCDRAQGDRADVDEAACHTLLKTITMITVIEWK